MPRSKGQTYPLRSMATEGGLIGLRFTTNGSGVPTLEDDYKGLISISQATNTYTISIGAVGVIKNANVSHSLTATVNCVTTTSASLGTLTLAFSGNFYSQTCDVISLFAETKNG